MADLFNSSKAKKKNSYDAADIQVLEGLEPVRHRPGMYIGGTDERALHHLVGEILDNSMDEAVGGDADWIEIELKDDYSGEVSLQGWVIWVLLHPNVFLETII